MAQQPSPKSGGKVSRRDFMKLMAAAGTVMTFAVFADWGKFLPPPKEQSVERQKVELPDGSQANVNSFPVNHAEAVIFPKSDDPVLNKEAFRTWQFIRLPEELGGKKNDASAFRMYSMVCLHLWCLWRYESKFKTIACPCHASTYDPSDGKAYAGPASLQSQPSNVLPRLDLEADAKGDLWILPPIWDLRKNGVVGYGRYEV